MNEYREEKAAATEEMATAFDVGLAFGDHSNVTAAAVGEQSSVAPTYQQIAPNLLAMGYAPIPILPGTKRPAVEGWTTAPGEGDVALWARECPDGGVGLICGAIVGIDIDVLDERLSADLERLTRDRLGDTPLVRIGMAPKRLLVYRVAMPFRGWKRHPLEVLAAGQQFVALAVHPDTGQPYQWPDASPVGVPPGDLPVVTEDMVRDWLEEAWAMIPPDLRPAPKARPAKAGKKVSPAIRRVNDAAMADLSWVEDLFPGIRRVGASWRLRPTWGGSDGKGGGLEEMVSFHRHGIWDFGNEVPMTPVEVLAAHRECSQSEAAAMLAPLVDVEYAPAPTIDEVKEAIQALPEAIPEEDEIEAVVALIARLDSDLGHDPLLKLVKTRTGVAMPKLRALLAEQCAILAAGADGPLPEDEGLLAARLTLDRYYQGGRHLIFAPDRSFWRYTGTHWVRATDEQVLHGVLAVVAEEFDDNVSAICRETLHLLSGMQSANGAKLRLTGEPLPVINCRNGELWIGDDGKVALRPHRPESYLTYVLNCEYAPDAACPTYDEALLGIFANATDPADMARHLNEVIGYAVQPRRDIPAWFLWRGPGANGKTKVIETVNRLVSADAIYSGRIGSLEQNRFAIGELAGKLILLDDDVTTGTKLPDGFLKTISERKQMTGEMKFKPCFSFVATCLPILLANNYPHCADLSHGMMRRAHVIPFDRKFSGAEKDATLFPRIWKTELPGVLNRAIEGLQRLMARGEFLEPADCVRAKADWMMQAHPLVAFLAECTAPTTETVPTTCDAETLAMLMADGKPAPEGVYLSDLYDLYKLWCEKAGVRNVTTRGRFKSALEDLGYTVGRDSYSKVLGIRVTEPGPF